MQGTAAVNKPRRGFWNTCSPRGPREEPASRFRTSRHGEKGQAGCFCCLSTPVSDAVLQETWQADTRRNLRTDRTGHECFSSPALDPLQESIWCISCGEVLLFLLEFLQEQRAHCLPRPYSFIGQPYYILFLYIQPRAPSLESSRHMTFKLGEFPGETLIRLFAL